MTKEEMLASTVRRYKRAGYRVTTPVQGDAAPSFLKGLEPDLVAERHDDHVVVEIRESHALHDSNDIRQFADVVAQQAGWRLELVTIAADEQSELTTNQLDNAMRAARAMANAGFTEGAYLAGWSFLDALVGDIASDHGLSSAKKPVLQVARDLAFRGILSSEDVADIDRAATIRNDIAHKFGVANLKADAVEDLLHFTERLNRAHRAVIA